MSKTPPLSEYMDYRIYLRDFYEHKRDYESVGRRKYSYAVFAAAADIKSPNYLKLIIDGQRNLSNEMIKKFSKALRFGKDEYLEFRLLVLYGQEKDPLERSRYLKDLSHLRLERKTQAGEVDLQALNTVPSWITLVLHQMADQEGVEFGNISELSQLIRSRPKNQTVEGALTRLLESGIFERDTESQEIVKVRETIESPENVPLDLVRKLQADLVYLGLESLFKDKPTEREFGGLTMALTQDEFERLKFELRKMRKFWHKEVAANRKSNKGERVYQMNIQLFPLTEKPENKKKGPLLTPREREEKREKEEIPTMPPEPEHFRQI